MFFGLKHILISSFSLTLCVDFCTIDKSPLPVLTGGLHAAKELCQSVHPELPVAFQAFVIVPAAVIVLNGFR